MKLNSEVFYSFSPEETIAWAREVATALKPGDVVLLTGDLGAGKTTLVQGLVQGLNSSDLVQSPTYVYLQIYEASFPIFHFDLYRLTGADDFLAMGFDEFFYKQGVCLIEWPERIQSILPEKALWIECSTKGENERSISLKRSLS